MAIVSGQTIAGGSNTGSATTALVFGGNVTANSLIIVAVCLPTASTLTSVTDSLNNTYSKVGPTLLCNATNNLFVYYTINSSSAACTVTATFGGSAVNDCVAREYTGLAAVKPFDYFVTGKASSNAPTIGPADTTKWPNEVVIAITGYDGFNGSIGAGMSNFTASETAAAVKCSIEDKILSATGTTTTPFVLSNTANWGIVQIAFADTTIGRSAVIPGNRLRPHAFSPGLAR